MPRVLQKPSSSSSSSKSTIVKSQKAHGRLKPVPDSSNGVTKHKKPSKLTSSRSTRDTLKAANTSASAKKSASKLDQVPRKNTHPTSNLKLKASKLPLAPPPHKKASRPEPSQMQSAKGSNKKSAPRERVPQPRPKAHKPAKSTSKPHSMKRNGKSTPRDRDASSDDDAMQVESSSSSSEEVWTSESESASSSTAPATASSSSSSDDDNDNTIAEKSSRKHAQQEKARLDRKSRETAAITALRTENNRLAQLQLACRSLSLPLKGSKLQKDAGDVSDTSNESASNSPTVKLYSIGGQQREANLAKAGIMRADGCLMPTLAKISDQLVKRLAAQLIARQLPKIMSMIPAASSLDNHNAPPERSSLSIISSAQMVAAIHGLGYNFRF